MNKLLTAVLALTVASVTGVAFAQDVAGDAKAGEKKIAMCIGCHGIPGYQASFSEIYKVPKISGQGGKYVASALHAYKKGDRKHPTMRGIGDTLSEQDIADLAAYYEQSGKADGATLPDAPRHEAAAPVAALLTKGACASCHGANFAKPIDPTYPKIAGQYADYLFVALKAYKTDNNPQVGRNNGIMGGVAKQFTNAELKALAGYVASLDGDLKSIPQSRFK